MKEQCTYNRCGLPHCCAAMIFLMMAMGFIILLHAFIAEWHDTSHSSLCLASGDDTKAIDDIDDGQSGNGGGDGQSTDPVDCPAIMPGMTDGVTSDCADTADGSVCTTGCDDGWVGDPTSYGCSNGAWLPTGSTDAECFPAGCAGDLPNLTGEGLITTCTDTDHGQTCTTACDDGYIGSPVEYTCDLGEWKKTDGTAADPYCFLMTSGIIEVKNPQYTGFDISWQISHPPTNGDMYFTVVSEGTTLTADQVLSGTGAVCSNSVAASASGTFNVNDCYGLVAGNTYWIWVAFDVDGTGSNAYIVGNYHILVIPASLTGTFDGTNPTATGFTFSWSITNAVSAGKIYWYVYTSSVAPPNLNLFISGSGAVCYGSYPQTASGNQIISSCTSFQVGLTYYLFAAVDVDGNGNSMVLLDGTAILYIPTPLSGSIVASAPSLAGFTFSWTLNSMQQGGYVYFIALLTSSLSASFTMTASSVVNNVNGVCWGYFPEALTGQETITYCSNFQPGETYTIFGAVDMDGLGGGAVLLLGSPKITITSCTYTTTDTLFLLDDSGSVTQHNWNVLTSWIGEWQNEDVIPLETPTAVLRFGESSIPQDYGWTEFSTAAEYKNAITGLPYGNGKTYTADGFKKAIELFNQKSGNGNGKLIILITDGEPNPADQTPCTDEIIQGIIDEGIMVMILGIGDFSIQAIQCVATSDNFILHTQFTSLADIEDEVRALYCHGPVVQCDAGRSDTILVIDDSGSIGQDNYDAMKYWMGNFQYEIMPVQTPVSVLRFGAKEVPVDYTWDVFPNAKAYSDAINGLDYSRGKTYTSTAMEKALDLYDERTTNNKKVVFLITDGVPTTGYSPCTADILDRISNNQVTVIIVGIGDFDYTQIQCLTTDPEYVIHVTDYSQLDDIEDKIHQLYCDDPATFLSNSNPNADPSTSSSNYVHCDERYSSLFGDSHVTDAWIGLLLLLLAWLLLCCLFGILPGILMAWAPCWCFNDNPHGFAEKSESKESKKTTKTTKKTITQTQSGGPVQYGYTSGQIISNPSPSPLPGYSSGYVTQSNGYVSNRNATGQHRYSRVPHQELNQSRTYYNSSGGILPS